MLDYSLAQAHSVALPGCGGKERGDGTFTLLRARVLGAGAICILLASLGRDQRWKNNFVLNVYHFCTIVKENKTKQSHATNTLKLGLLAAATQSYAWFAFQREVWEVRKEDMSYHGL